MQLKRHLHSSDTCDAEKTILDQKSRCLVRILGGEADKKNHLRGKVTQKDNDYSA